MTADPGRPRGPGSAPAPLGAALRAATPQAEGVPARGAAGGGPGRRAGRRRAAALLLLAAFLLAGCWDLEEIDRRTVVLGLAFDLAPGGGWRMLATVPDPRALVPSGGTAIGPQPEEPAYVVLETRGQTAAEALAALRDVTSRDLFLGQIMVVGVSDRLARRGIGALLEFLMNDTDIPRAAWFVVGRGDPKQVMTVKPPQQTFPEFYLDDVLRARSKPAGMLGLPYWRLWVTTLDPGRDAVVPLVERGPEGQMRVARVAVFRGHRMVGVLSAEETRLLALTRDARNTAWQVQMGQGRTVTLRPLGVHTDIVPLSPEADGSPRFRFDVKVNAVLMEAHGFSGPHPRLFERHATVDLTRSIQRLLGRLQRLGADPWGFGERWRIAHPRAFAQRAWRSQWPRAQVDVQVRVNISRGGAFH
ncbi:MAG TPA: Ger(x)C family spore germination protein [Thermaerobacter sp.]